MNYKIQKQLQIPYYYINNELQIDIGSTLALPPPPDGGSLSPACRRRAAAGRPRRPRAAAASGTSCSSRPARLCTRHTPSVPEMQKNTSIYNLFSSLLMSFKDEDNFIFHYLTWEINFLKEIGYDLNLNRFYKDSLDNNSISSIKLDNEIINIPNFLLNKNFKNIEIKLVYLAFKFIGNYMYKQVFRPNNLTHSVHRKNLENLFKI